MHTTTRALGRAAVLSAVAVAAMSVAVGSTFGVAPFSKPEFVTAECKTPRHERACRIALRYLAALDLDRHAEACRLLAPSTLQAAGGMRGCVRRLSDAAGIRIRYAILAARGTPLGTTIRFTTQGMSGTPVVQDMVVSRVWRITMVLPVGFYEPAGHSADG